MTRKGRGRTPHIMKVHSFSAIGWLAMPSLFTEDRKRADASLCCGVPGDNRCSKTQRCAAPARLLSPSHLAKVKSPAMSDSFWDRVSKGINWYLPPIAINPEDVKPDSEEVGTMQTAIKEMMACKDIFDGWGEQLDRRMSGQMDSTEQEIRTAISTLRDDADASLRACYDIVESQRTLCRIMNRRLQRAVEHDSGILQASPEIETLSRSISLHSSNISEHVQRMVERLQGLADFIENLKPTVTVEKKTIWQRICGWLREAFNAVAAIFVSAANICFGISGTSAFTAGGLLAIGSAISAKMTAICEKFSRGNINENQKFDEILHFLKTTIPSEANMARNHLVSFQAQQRLVRVELMMKSGRRVQLRGESARRAQDDWDVQEGRLQLVRVG
ncbi:hypothetical protein BD410DRAFT_608882 [Rickenella mellea]|uniref:Uncharacterized protein n=1 Tax=Rickenella mellea TaxID=50990 RepID=A0A4Y7QDQ1_9AGAM|nr:hypothetical protein BD410DRAFT_608882 [Rickenella mellea]